MSVGWWIFFSVWVVSSLYGIVRGWRYAAKRQLFLLALIPILAGPLVEFAVFYAKFMDANYTPEINKKNEDGKD